MTTEEVLAGLDPRVADKADLHILLCHREGIALGLTQGYRTFAEQQARYDQGRTAPGAIVTNARPGYSWHNWKRAYDVKIVTFPGDPAPGDVYDGPWARVIELGERAGMLAGGRWKHPDLPHFEDHLGETLPGLLAGHPAGLA